MYDIVFISYQETNADTNWTRLKSRFPMAKRVHGIKGIHNAHIIAAKKCFTDMVWVVDGDAEILESFAFDYKADKRGLETVHVWRSLNPVNYLEYGNGGVKLLPRQLTINMDTSKPDMTTSISRHFKAMPTISNVTAFNTDEFNTWKSAFRECVKLSSKVIDRQKEEETNTRLRTWCTAGQDKQFGKYAIAGAKAGAKYGMMHKDNVDALKMINDFSWLEEQFNREYDGKEH
jgi:hypothetical protein